MRRKATGHFELPIPADDAIGFFTPEGERSWADGWAPTYPSGEPTEAPGTVYVTSHGDIETVWVIQKIDRGAHTSEYSRFTAGHHAGTVRVRCEDRPDNRCVVSVEYDMTALSPDHPGALDPYNEEAFEAMMRHWSDAVHSTL